MRVSQIQIGIFPKLIYQFIIFKVHTSFFYIVSININALLPSDWQFLLLWFHKKQWSMSEANCTRILLPLCYLKTAVLLTLPSAVQTNDSHMVTNQGCKGDVQQWPNTVALISQGLWWWYRVQHCCEEAITAEATTRTSHLFDK